MNPKEIVAEILKLPPLEAQALLREASLAIQSQVRRAVRPGQKVRFVTRHGVVIEGTVDRVNPKNVVVEAHTDRLGLKTTRPVMWTVSPGLLEAVTS